MLEYQDDLIGHLSQLKTCLPHGFQKKTMVNNEVFIQNYFYCLAYSYLKNVLLINVHILILKEGNSADFECLPEEGDLGNLYALFSYFLYKNRY